MACLAARTVKERKLGRYAPDRTARRRWRATRPPKPVPEVFVQIAYEPWHREIDPDPLETYRRVMASLERTHQACKEYWRANWPGLAAGPA